MAGLDDLGERISRALGGRDYFGGEKGIAPRGYSLCIGVNEVDTNVYGSLAKLKGPENDAQSVRDLLLSQGFASDILLTKSATSRNVLSWLTSMASVVAAGDSVVLFYSGHGGQVPDLGADENDRLDETLCLYDRMLVDDEIYAAFSRFNPQCNIVMLSDSCHSGTVLKNMGLLANGKYLEAYNYFLSSIDLGLSVGLPKALAPDRAFALYAADASLYQGIQWACQPKGDVAIPAVLISACLDSQSALDGSPNSLFTRRLLDVWGNGKFVGSYEDLHRSLSSGMSPMQCPNLYLPSPTSVNVVKRPAFKI